MKNFTKIMIASICGASAMLPSSASAFQGNSQDGCYATEVVTSNQGLTSNGAAVPANRSDVNMALMSPDMSNAAGGFYSLGMGGSITLKFGGAVYNSDGNDIMVYETSYSGDTCGRGDDEKAMIEVSQDGNNWIPAGEICRDGGIDLEGLGVPFVTQIRITDMTTNSGDGYDVDGVVAIGGCDQVNDVDVCYGSFVVVDSYIQGNTKNGAPIEANRTNTDNALGMPENDDTINFVSLGYGGEITIGFDGVVLNQDGDDLAVLETTFNNGTFESYPESANVFVSQNGVDFYLIGEDLTNVFATLDISNAVDAEGNPVPLDYITLVKLVDTTPSDSRSQDAFDLDGIVALTGCTVPQDPNFDVCYATEVLEYIEGTKKNGGVIDGVRTATPENVLGEPEGTDSYVFTTLGYGGSIKLAFNGSVFNGEGDDLLIVETSFNQPVGCDAYPEFADVYVSFDDITYRFAGTVCKSNNKIDISDAGDYEYINFVKIVNNDILSTTPDGYDLDGVVAISTCTDYDLDGDDVLSATSQTFDSSDVAMFPVPASDRLNIKLNNVSVSSSSANASYEIVSLLGQSYNRGTVDVKAGKTEISEDISRLADGTYFFILNVDGTTTTKQFVKVSK